VKVRDIIEELKADGWYQVAVETARTGGYEVVHIPMSLIEVINHEKFRNAGLRMHWGNADSELEIRAAVQSGDQVSTCNVAAAVVARH
jgi:hypothetical protein